MKIRWTEELIRRSCIIRHVQKTLREICVTFTFGADASSMESFMWRQKNFFSSKYLSLPTVCYWSCVTWEQELRMEFKYHYANLRPSYYWHTKRDISSLCSLNSLIYYYRLLKSFELRRNWAVSHNKKFIASTWWLFTITFHL